MRKTRARKMGKPFGKILTRYLQEKEYFDTLSTTSAPSGEWAEYNYDYMIQEAVVEAFEAAVNSFNSKDRFCLK